MIILVGALLLMGVALGPVAHVPLPVTLVATAAICGWLLVFTARERYGFTARERLGRRSTRRS